MKIGIDISPLSSGHKVRGVGFYLVHLKDALLKYYPEQEYVFFQSSKEIPRNIDVIHYPYFDPFFLTLPITRWDKTVVTVHDLTPLVLKNEFPIGMKGFVKWHIQRLLLKSVRSIITDSENSKKDIIKLVGVPPNKVTVTYLAAGEEFKRLMTPDKGLMIKKKYDLPEKFALYVGDVTPNKNVPNIMKACIQAQIPLVMVGKALTEDLYDKENLWNADLVKAQLLAQENKQIHMLGFVSSEDLVMLYNLAQLVVLASRYEGFGLPILEAMACGCPVVTSRAGSLEEIAGDGAYFVDPQNVNSIAQGIIAVWNNPTLQKEIQEKGLQQAKKFSWKQTATDTIQAYKDVLQEK